MAIQQVRSAPVSAKPPTGSSAADLKTATQLKGSILEVLKRVRFDVLKKVPLKKENHPDGFTYTGLILKSDPNKVVIQRSGGIAGLSTWSQAIDVTRLPR